MMVKECFCNWKKKTIAMPSLEFLEEIRHKFVDISAKELKQHLVEFEEKNGVTLDNYEKVTNDRQLCKSIKQHLRAKSSLGKLAESYYAGLEIEFGGLWPLEANYNVLPLKELAEFNRKLPNGDIDEIGTIQWSFYKARTPLEDRGRTFKLFDIDIENQSVIYIDYVHIYDAFQGMKVDPAGNLGSTSPDAVSLATMMVTEFLRQAFLATNHQWDVNARYSPNDHPVDSVFLWISSAKPIAAFVAYTNAGLYNDLHVFERKVRNDTLIFYTMPPRVLTEKLF